MAAVSGLDVPISPRWQKWLKTRLKMTHSRVNGVRMTQRLLTKKNLRLRLQLRMQLKKSKKESKKESKRLKRPPKLRPSLPPLL